MKILSYVRPGTIEEAMKSIHDGGTVIGGGTWLKLVPKPVDVAVDITDLSLDEVHRDGDIIEIGSMVTLHELASEPEIQGLADGMLVNAVRHIMGVPFRNIATVGGTIVGKYGFSDLLTPLLSLDATLHFHDAGSMTLEDYLEGDKVRNDLLVKVTVNAACSAGAFLTIKRTSNDFAILNAAVTRCGYHYRVAVGARPGVATLSHEAMGLLNSLLIEDDIHGRLLSIEKMTMAGDLAAAELKFGSNARGSQGYREHLCRTLVTRCVQEVQG